MSDFKKIINFSELSEQVTGSRNTIRSNRKITKNYSQVQELFDYIELWVEKNAKSKEVKVTIKTK